MGARWGELVSLDTWWATTRWQIAEATGWTLDTIEALSFEDVFEYLSVLDARAKSVRKPKKGGRR